MRDIEEYINQSCGMKTSGDGRQKLCFSFQDDGAALLKYKFFSQDPVTLEEICALMEREKGISDEAAKTLAFKVVGEELYVLQRLAKGEPICGTYHDAEQLYRQAKEKEETKEWRQQFTRINLERSNILSRAPQKHFDKFIERVKELFANGIEVDFCMGANFYYDKTSGFSVVDRGLCKPQNILKGKKQRLYIQKRAFEVFTSRADGTVMFKVPLSDSEEAQMSKNMNVIMKKVAIALIRGGFPREEVEVHLNLPGKNTVKQRGVSSKPKARLI